MHTDALRSARCSDAAQIETLQVHVKSKSPVSEASLHPLHSLCVNGICKYLSGIF